MIKGLSGLLLEPVGPNLLIRKKNERQKTGGSQ